MDTKTLILISKERKVEAVHDLKLKNKFLRMSNTARKQAGWNKHFTPVPPPDDSYLAGKVF